MLAEALAVHFDMGQAGEGLQVQPAQLQGVTQLTEHLGGGGVAVGLEGIAQGGDLHLTPAVELVPAVCHAQAQAECVPASAEVGGQGGTVDIDGRVALADIQVAITVADGRAQSPGFIEWQVGAEQGATVVALQVGNVVVAVLVAPATVALEPECQAASGVVV